MDNPLDREYFMWLYGQVGSVRLRNRKQTHWGLLRQLFTKQFAWVIPLDENRAEDGKDLRREWLDEHGPAGVDESWLGLECSMLELLIALAQRLSFEGGGESREWFWRMLDNLDLAHFNDSVYTDLHYDGIDAALDCVINRTYSPTGEGGLFPLQRPYEDQRTSELWNQLCAYILEQL